MAFSFSTSASEAEAAVNARASATATAPPPLPGNSLLELVAGDPIPPSGGGSQGKIGWDPSRLSTVAGVFDERSNTGGTVVSSNAGSGTAAEQSGHGKAKIGWDPSRVGVADKPSASDGAGSAAVEASGKNEENPGWDVSRVGLSRISDNDNGGHEAVRDGQPTDMTLAGSGSGSGSGKVKIGWDPSRLGATTAGQPAAAGGGGGGAALSSEQQGELEREVAAGVGGRNLTTTLASSGRPRVPVLSPSSSAERGEQGERQEQPPPRTKQQQQQQQQSAPRPRIGWDPKRMSDAVALTAKDALPSPTQALPACGKASDSAEKGVQEVTGVQPIPAAHSSSIAAAASTGENKASTAPRKIGWNASRVGDPAIPAPTMSSNATEGTMEAVAGSTSGAKAGIGWDASRVANPVVPAPAMSIGAVVPKAVGVAGAEAATAAKPRIGWNASRVGNPIVPAPVTNEASAPAVAGVAEVATAVTAAVAVAGRTVAGREGGDERAAAAVVDEGGVARRREVPLQLRAVLLYASTQRGIDLRKWFNLGGDGAESDDEEEEEQQDPETGEGERVLRLLVGWWLIRFLPSAMPCVCEIGRHVCCCCRITFSCSTDPCTCLQLSVPGFAATLLHRVLICPSGHRGPNHTHDGPVRARVSGTGGRPQGDY